jgi:hypothetical protein
MLGVLNSDGLELAERDVLVQALYTFSQSGESFGKCYHLVLVGD